MEMRKKAHRFSKLRSFPCFQLSVCVSLGGHVVFVAFCSAGTVQWSAYRDDNVHTHVRAHWSARTVHIFCRSRHLQNGAITSPGRCHCLHATLLVCSIVCVAAAATRLFLFVYTFFARNIYIHVCAIEHVCVWQFCAWISTRLTRASVATPVCMYDV